MRIPQFCVLHLKEILPLCKFRSTEFVIIPPRNNCTDFAFYIPRLLSLVSFKVYNPNCTLLAALQGMYMYVRARYMHVQGPCTCKVHVRARYMHVHCKVYVSTPSSDSEQSTVCTCAHCTVLLLHETLCGVNSI